MQKDRSCWFTVIGGETVLVRTLALCLRTLNSLISDAQQPMELSQNAVIKRDGVKRENTLMVNDRKVKNSLRLTTE